MKKQSDSIISYLAATAPALLQLLGVISLELVNVLKFNQFVFLPSFINIANFLVILFSLSLISLNSFWDQNKITFIDVKKGENIFSPVKRYWKTLRIFFGLSIIGFLLFIAIAFFKSKIDSNIPFWTFIQWTSYIASMVSVSFIIYAYVLLKIQEKRNNELQENFIPRLIDSLRRYGHVKSPDILIEYINRTESQAIVKLGGVSKYLVRMDYTGEMISIESYKPQPVSTSQAPSEENKKEGKK